MRGLIFCLALSLNCACKEEAEGEPSEDLGVAQDHPQLSDTAPYLDAQFERDIKLQGDTQTQRDAQTLGDIQLMDIQGHLDASPQTAALEERLQVGVEMLAQEIGSRSSHTPEKLQRAIDYFRGELESTGLPMQIQEFEVGGQTFSNLIFEVRGRERPEEIIVVGAHYDSVPSTPGADDNATGAIATLELARHFAAQPQAQTLRFLLFANEEPPFFQTDGMGSLIYARSLQQAGEEVVLMFSLEMLGFYSDEPNSQELPMGLAGLFPTTGNFIAFVSDFASRELLDEAHAAFRVQGLPAEKLAAPAALPEAGFSDHWSFWQVGYPAIMITDTAFLRNPHYHAPTDSVETLDLSRYTRAVEGIQGMLEVLANP